MWCWALCWSLLVLRLTSVSVWRIKKISRETCWGLLDCPWEEQGSPWRSTELKTCHKVNPETGCFLFNCFNLHRRHTLVNFLLFCCLQWMMLSWMEWGRSSGLTATERTWWTRWWRSTSQAKQCVLYLRNSLITTPTWSSEANLGFFPFLSQVCTKILEKNANPQWNQQLSMPIRVRQK